MSAQADMGRLLAAALRFHLSRQGERQRWRDDIAECQHLGASFIPPLRRAHEEAAQGRSQANIRLMSAH
jgi:hypothetical protein